MRRFTDVLPQQLLQELGSDTTVNGGYGWLQRGAAPSRPHERAAEHIGALIGEPYGSVEFWTNGATLPAGTEWGETPFDYHFDNEEEEQSCAAFPYVSTVLYLDDFGPEWFEHERLYGDTFDP